MASISTAKQDTVSLPPTVGDLHNSHSPLEEVALKTSMVLNNRLQLPPPSSMPAPTTKIVYRTYVIASTMAEPGFTDVKTGVYHSGIGYQTHVVASTMEPGFTDAKTGVYYFADGSRPNGGRP